MEMERPRREDGQQQMDTQAPCGTPEKAEETWDDYGRDGLTNSKYLRVTNGPEVRKTACCGKNKEKKNFNSIGLAHL